MDDLLQTTVNAEEGRRHSNANIDMKLEAIVIPVSDVDRAKEFYTRLGWRLDADHAGGNGHACYHQPRFDPLARNSVTFH
jgi:hypothetical protein